MPGKALTSVAQHVDLAWMYEAYRLTRKDGAVGSDGQGAEQFAANLEENLATLLNRAKGGSYRAPSVRRVHIPKGDGQKTRPIGVPTFADKVLQRAVAMALTAIYEGDFYDFSFGFRPGRSAREAAEALRDHVWRQGGWVLEVDIASFFDTLDHAQLQDLLRRRVTDGVIVRLVGKWLSAGVLDGGITYYPDRGTPQGGVISPVLANIYLHEVLDTWWVTEVLPRLRGKAHLVRYADDFVMVFERHEDAVRVQGVLPKRFGRYGLTLHPEKTRLVRFGRPAGGSGDHEEGPETFDFLGFTYYWARSRKGYWVVKQKTARSRLRRFIRRMNEWLRGIRHEPIPAQAQALSIRLRGHYAYYGVIGNSAWLTKVYRLALRLWRKWLSRRSQRSEIAWDSFRGILARNHVLAPTGPTPVGGRQRTLGWKSRMQ